MKTYNFYRKCTSPSQSDLLKFSKSESEIVPRFILSLTVLQNGQFQELERLEASYFRKVLPALVL